MLVGLKWEMVFKTILSVITAADKHKPAIYSNENNGSERSPDLEIRRFDQSPVLLIYRQ